ncbi:MAG: SUMF1/EgtB/PvdO family nonheme iron enzyme [Acidobacteriota bacterium]|nr:SUMF1/EgtB/PvdO family nonheme iron enzyme [Acidobacteriota bacterium]
MALAIAAAATQAQLAPGTTFRDCDVCPEMVVVPAGSFVMGSPADEPGRYDDEGPARDVTIAEPFAIGVREVVARATKPETRAAAAAAIPCSTRTGTTPAPTSSG